MGRKFWGKSLAQGEGGPKGRVRGEEKNLCTPHPPLRGTLSLRERESFSDFDGLIL
jgi:hypothetical protein